MKYKYGDVREDGKIFQAYRSYKTKTKGIRVYEIWTTQAHLDKSKIYVTKNSQKYAKALMSTVDGHIYKRFHSRKHDAKRLGHEFSITLDYAISIKVDVCPILNIPLTWCNRSKVVTDGSPSLDRINSSKGYVFGNVAWISAKANRIKNSGTADDHLAVYNWMKLHDMK